MTTASHPIASKIIGFMSLIGGKGDRAHTNRPPRGFTMSVLTQNGTLCPEDGWENIWVCAGWTV